MDPKPKAMIRFLGCVQTTRDKHALADRVGLYDRVTLRSPIDRRYVLKVSIVMPPDEDFSIDRYSVHEPLSPAILGRSRGQTVCWNAPIGLRRMTIASIEKSGLAAR